MAPTSRRSNKALVSGAALPPSLARRDAAARASRRARPSPPPNSASSPTRPTRDGALAARHARQRRLLLEIVRPGNRTNPLGHRGKVGEIVVTALRGNYPLLRFATGDLDLDLDATASAAGWAARIRRPRSRACSSIRAQIVESASAIPNSARFASSWRRENEQDAMTLRAETAARPKGCVRRLRRPSRASPSCVARWSSSRSALLPNDGKIDRRTKGPRSKAAAPNLQVAAVRRGDGGGRRSG